MQRFNSLMNAICEAASARRMASNSTVFSLNVAADLCCDPLCHEHLSSKQSRDPSQDCSVEKRLNSSPQRLTRQKATVERGRELPAGGMEPRPIGCEHVRLPYGSQLPAPAWATLVIHRALADC